MLFTFPISIHALLAESDGISSIRIIGFSGFLSTLSLRRATPKCSVHDSKLEKFLSTLSLRRATTHKCAQQPKQPNFYPRSPCGERQSIFKNNILCSLFLSTLSLRRATFQTSKLCNLLLTFLSTLSLRRATYRQGEKQANQSISIHALLAESD